MAFPFLFMALALAAGIVLSSCVNLSLGIWLLLLAICLAFAWISFSIFKKIKLSFVFILLTTFFFGSSLYVYHEKNYEDNPLHQWEAPAYADFYGTLSRSPVKGRDREILYVKVDKVAYQNREERMHGNMQVSVLGTPERQHLQSLHSHDRVKVSAKLISSKGFQNFTPPPQLMSLKSQNIHQRAITKSPLLVEKLSPGKSYSPLRLISILRQKLQQKIEEHFQTLRPSDLSPQGAVLEALLLGERSRMDTSITRSLQSSGLYHLFAISGAHIAIISFLLFSLFKMSQIPTRISYGLLIVFLVFYAFLVEGRASVLRATIMALAFLFGKLIWRDVNLVNTLSFSAFFLLLINPFHLFALGFQLTFVATLSIVVFYPKVIKHLPRIPLRISEMFALSLTAQLGVLPFIARAFNRVTFSSLLLNCAALPLVGLIMIAGYIFLPLSFLSQPAAHILSRGIHFLINLLISVSRLLHSVPHLSFRVPTPPGGIIIGYFFGLLLFLLPARVKRQKFIAALCFFIFFAVLITYPFPSASKWLKATFIDVGQGESILVEFPGRKKMLIDGGGFPTGIFDVGENVVSPFLWRKGIKKIDYLVLTHAHPDHSSGLEAVARNFKIGEFWEAFSPSEDKAYEELKHTLAPEVVRKRMFRGNTEFLGNIKVECFHPIMGNLVTHSVENNQSLVLRISYGRTAFLFTGDIDADAEQDILRTAQDISSKILKSPHHGSSSSSSGAFLQNVRPQIVVISAGEGNTYGFPHNEVLKRYRDIGAEVYRTDLQGAVEVSSDGHRLFVRTALK